MTSPFAHARPSSLSAAATNQPLLRDSPLQFLQDWNHDGDGDGDDGSSMRPGLPPSPGSRARPPRAATHGPQA